jgi:mersacidin/lichenicidin family type 2 lantibiotic
MSNSDIIRAWKDEDYRKLMGEEQRAMLPDNPAGQIDLSESEMEALAGGRVYGNTIGIRCPVPAISVDDGTC